MSVRCCLLVVAKAPVAGSAKTRLCPPASPEQAADIAAAALLDTLEAAACVPNTVAVVAMTGELAAAQRSADLARALRSFTAIEQRGDAFAERLATAHADVASLYPGLPVVQIGMDTPHATTQLLDSTIVRLLRRDVDAVLGLAEDGGWWALGLKDPLRADVLCGIPMSRSDTGRRTLDALHNSGLRTGTLPVLSDVDTWDDANRVAARVPFSRFASAVADVNRVADGVR
ncbi:MAG: DUF2064 domain-containing protein [Kutzneria sp.]|nr:DUF2064 domain-containing protein [Kutzneria sp.]